MKVIIISIIILFPLIVFAHEPARDNVDAVAPFCGSAEHFDGCSQGHRHIFHLPVLPDSVDVRRQKNKHFWRAGAETIGFNIGLWAFDRYVLDGHYAYISWNTIKENFKHGFEWDDDHLHTNMFDHPYNGSIFFNAGRSNGLSLIHI